MLDSHPFIVFKDKWVPKYFLTLQNLRKNPKLYIYRVENYMSLENLQYLLPSKSYIKCGFVSNSKWLDYPYFLMIKIKTHQNSYFCSLMLFKEKMGLQPDLLPFLLFHSPILREVLFSFAFVLPAAKMGTMCLLKYSKALWWITTSKAVW